MAAKVSAASLKNPQHTGMICKQGGSIKTWHDRWMVLKDDTLWYFKSQKDTEQKGFVKLEKQSVCQTEPSRNKKGKSFFSVKSSPEEKRTYIIYTDSDEKTKEWVEKIQIQINELKGIKPAEKVEKKAEPVQAAPAPTPAAAEPKKEPEKPKEAPTQAATPKADTNSASKAASTPAKGGADVPPRQRLAAAKDRIPFLQDDDSKVLEFWQIWSESIPSIEDLEKGMEVEYHVSTSANMQKLTWRTAGPQNIFIQKMVDFFWNVGAPESEIDRLNDVGAMINPLKIGSWIDMSAKGGMDGGWYFPVKIDVQQALKAADAGDPTKKVMEWAQESGVTECYSVGRDMGAAPPRQTEIRIQLHGDSFEKQVDLALGAFKTFGFKDLPDTATSILKNSGEHVGTSPLNLSVITSSEGFVRLGILVPKPSTSTVVSLCELCGANKDELNNFEGSLGATGPAYAEYQYLKDGFGYGVYKEGFDIVFHYVAGVETSST